MANYELNNTGACSTDKLYVTAHPIYGSSRLGVDMRKTLLYNGLNFSNDTLTRTNRILSLKQYELSNHLGNVLATITDKKIPKRVGGSGPIKAGGLGGNRGGHNVFDNIFVFAIQPGEDGYVAPRMDTPAATSTPATPVINQKCKME